MYMEVSLRPWFTTGVAIVGAGAIAMAPINPITQSSRALDMRAATAAISSEVQLTAFEIPYILTLPVVRQSIRNWAENWAVYLAGLAKSGVGLAESLLAIPGVTVEIIQEVLALDLVGAFDTFTAAVRDSVVAVGQPLLDSLIWRNQKYYAVQTALEAAVPRAFIDVANGFLEAGNVVTTSLIQGTQDLIAAVLTLNLSNIIDAALGGTRNFLVALGDGAVAIVDGIEAAQLGIATALATEPPPAPAADDSALRTLAVETTRSPAGASSDDPLDAIVSTRVRPTTSAAEVTVLVESAPGPAGASSAVANDAVRPPEATVGEVEVLGTGAEAGPQDLPEEPDDGALAGDISHEATAPASPTPKEPVGTTAVKDPKDDEETVKKVTTGVGDQKDSGVKNDARSAEKPAADADDE
jgi:hypothetical protein